MSENSEAVLTEKDIQELLEHPRGFFGLIFRNSKANNKSNYEVLLVFRDDLKIWNLPGGGEDLDDLGVEGANKATKREVLEETGLSVRPLFTVAAAVDGLIDKANPIGAESRADFYVGTICAIEDGELRLTDESVSAKWFSTNDLPDELYERHRSLINMSVADEQSRELIDKSIRLHSDVPESIE